MDPKLQTELKVCACDLQLIQARPEASVKSRVGLAVFAVCRLLNFTFYKIISRECSLSTICIKDMPGPGKEFSRHRF